MTFADQFSIRRRALARIAGALMLCAALFGGGLTASYAQGGGTIGGGQGSGNVKPKPTRDSNVNRSPSIVRRKPVVRPTTPSVNFQRVNTLLSQGDSARQNQQYAQAETFYRQASNLNPKEDRAWIGLGNVAYDQKQFNEALTFYQRATTADPKNSEGFARVAFTYVDLQQPAQAVSWAQRGVRAESDEAYPYIALGWAQFASGDYNDAERAYRQAIQLQGTESWAGVHYELARSVYEQRRYRDALTELGKAVQKDSNNYPALFLQAVTYQKLGQLNDALNTYQRTIALNNDDYSSYSNSGLVYYVQGNGAQARSMWQTAIQKGSTYAPDRIGIMILDGNLAQAQRELETYTQNNAGDEDGWLMLSDVYRALGNANGARMADARAAAIAPEYVALQRPDIRRMSSSGSNNTRPSNNSNSRPVNNSGGDNSGESYNSEMCRKARQPNDKGQTILMIAAARGEIGAARAAIQQCGVDTNLQDADGDPALTYAAGGGNSEMVALLLREGAYINGKNKKGLTALMAAAGLGKLDAVKMLIERGADINAKDNSNQTALSYARARNQTAIAQYLQSKGAR